MLETLAGALAMVLCVVILIGFVVGIIAYKPVRNKLIREKGYDADSEGKGLFIAAIASAFIGLCASESGVGDFAIIAGLGVSAVLILILLVKRVKAVGIGNALLVTLLQVLSMAWLFFAWFFKLAWNMFNGFTSNHIAVEGKKEQVSRDAALKAQLLQEYEAKAAQIAGHSDVEAAAIAAVKLEEQGYEDR